MYDDVSEWSALKDAVPEYFASGTVKPFSIDNEKKALSELKRLCRDALDKYPTTLGRDLDRLRSLDMSVNERNALRLVIDEKQLLKQLSSWATYMFNLLDDDDRQRSVERAQKYEGISIKSPEYMT